MRYNRWAIHAPTPPPVNNDRSLMARNESPFPINLTCPIIVFQESLSRGRNTMICVFMPNITQGMLSDTAKMITRTVTCLQWPRERGARELFWLMLHKAIMDGTDPHVNHLPPEN